MATLGDHFAFTHIQIFSDYDNLFDIHNLIILILVRLSRLSSQKTNILNFLVNLDSFGGITYALQTFVYGFGFFIVWIVFDEFDSL